jgi:hypothetical protein
MDIQTWVKLNVGCTEHTGDRPVCSVHPTLSLTHVCISIGLSPVCSVHPTLSLTHVYISIGLSPVCSVHPTLSLTHVCISIGLSPVCSVCPTLLNVGCTEHTGDRLMDI